MLPFEWAPPQGGERESLVGFLNQNRSVMLWKLEGLNEDLARRAAVPSGTSMLGLIKHLAWVERGWFLRIIGGQEIDYPWTDEDPDGDFRIEEDETITSISQLYVDAVKEANAAIEAADSLDVTGTRRGKERSLRWVLIHMIEETARHAGHADIIRETLDGVTGYLPED